MMILLLQIEGPWLVRIENEHPLLGLNSFHFHEGTTHT